MELEDKLKNARKQVSDYAVAFDFLGKITHSESEDEVIHSILTLFEMLFLPEKIRYISLTDQLIHKVNSVSAQKVDGDSGTSNFEEFKTNYSWALSGKGFRVKLQHHEVEFGIIEIDHLKFAEYKEHYLNLVLAVADVCALAIENARRLRKILDTENALRIEKEKLQEALAKVKTLSGLLPICSYCKNIRDDSGYWNKIEHYIHQHSDVEFSHSICKHCADKLFPDLDIYSE